jgi:YcaO-like protein with predicted kinase domain
VDVERVDAKGFVAGTHRLCPPEETYERFAPHMRRCGITRVANITGLDTVGVPVFVAVRPGSRGLTTSQGKGLSAAAARTSAMMESFEGWHGERVARVACYARAEEVEDLTQVPLARLDGLVRRGARARTGQRTAWVTGTDLLTGDPLAVPFDAVSTDFTGSLWQTPFVRTTNGLASGNSETEAALHALYEVVERDAVTGWDADAGGDVVDPSSVVDPYNAELLERLARARHDVLLRRVPSDVGVPVFSAVITPGPGSAVAPFAAFSGFGAHLDPRVALARAVTEAVQSRLAMIQGSRDDLWPTRYAGVSDHRAVWPGSEVVRAQEPSLRLDDVPDRSTATFSGDLAILVERLRDHVPQAVHVSLTDPELGIPVVKVVVPGLDGIPFDLRRRHGGRAREEVGAR